MQEIAKIKWGDAMWQMDKGRAWYNILAQNVIIVVYSRKIMYLCRHFPINISSYA